MVGAGASLCGASRAVGVADRLGLGTWLRRVLGMEVPEAVVAGASVVVPRPGPVAAGAMWVRWGVQRLRLR